MKTYLLLGILSVVVAEPALAQYRSPPVYPYGYASPAQLIDQLARRIDDDVRYRIITRAEAQRLRIEAERLRRLEYQYGNDGLSRWERSDLARQIDRLRGDVLAAERSRFGGGGVIVPRSAPVDDDPDGRRWEDRYGDRDTDRWDDRGARADDDYDRDDDSRYRDDRDEDLSDQDTDDARSIPDQGDDADDAIYEPGGGYPEELHVGDRAPVNLGLLPPEMRTRYRDGNGVYYRYWNGTIYQIDDRTDTIRWIGRAGN